MALKAWKGRKKEKKERSREIGRRKERKGKEEGQSNFSGSAKSTTLSALSWVWGTPSNSGNSYIYESHTFMYMR